MRIECLGQLRIAGTPAQLPHRAVGDDPALDPLLRMRNKLPDSGNLAVEGPGRYETESPWHPDLVIRAVRCLVRQAEYSEGGGRRLRLPHGFDRREPHLLTFRGHVAAHLPEPDHRQAPG